jgi:hypothetical protein
MPALIAAKADFLPDLLPFFAPAERSLADRAGFLGEIFLPYAFHRRIKPKDSRIV